GGGVAGRGAGRDRDPGPPGRGAAAAGLPLEADQTRHRPQARRWAPPGRGRRRPGALALWRELTMAGWCGRWCLGESGFSPTLPPGSAWARVGTRARVWDEPPQGRRLNVLGALAPCGETPDLVWTAPPGKIDSAVLLDFLWREVAGLPAPPERVPTDYRRP